MNLTGLTANTSYTFKAYSDSNCTTANLLATKTFATKLATVTDVSAAARDTKLAVTWTAVTGATRYRIQWKSGNQNWSTSRETTSSSASKTLTTLANDTEYTIQVRAERTNNNGAWSATATGTPAEETLTVSGISATGATLTIGNYSGSWYYKYTVPTTGGSCTSAWAGDGDVCDAEQSEPRHDLHVQGLQQQQLLHGIGDGVQLHH